MNSNPIDSRTFKDVVYKQLARVGKALSSGPRLEILDLLTQGPRTVESIADDVAQSIANTSHHLRTLARARLVECERSGLYVTYRIADADVAMLLSSMRSLADARLRELQQVTRDFLEQRDALDSIGADELRARLASGDVTLLDVRPADEFEAAHLPGALSVPVRELEARLDELPRDIEVVAYCRGPYCVMALDAVDALRASGFRARHFRDSIADWQRRGFSVCAGAS